MFRKIKVSNYSVHLALCIKLFTLSFHTHSLLAGQRKCLNTTKAQTFAIRHSGLPQPIILYGEVCACNAYSMRIIFCSESFSEVVVRMAIEQIKCRNEINSMRCKITQIIVMRHRIRPHISSNLNKCSLCRAIFREFLGRMGKCFVSLSASIHSF